MSVNNEKKGFTSKFHLFVLYLKNLINLLFNCNGPTH